VAAGAGNTLGLVGDGDEVDALEAVEAMFDLRLDPEAVSRMATVGDLYDWLLTRIRTRPGSCATSMAFYRLRRALQPQGQPRLAPDAPLKSLVVGSPRKFRERLGAETGLEIPAMGGTFLSLAGYTLFLVAFLAGGLAVFRSDLPMGLYAIAGLVLSVLLIHFDPQAVPGEFKTLGLFAQHTATLNFSKMAKGGAQVTEQSVWDALCLALADHGELPRGEIGHDTTLIG
jgi:hypothetical protein